MHDHRTGRNGCLKTTEQLAEHLMGLFAGAAQERALLLALDSRSRVRATLWLKDGTSDRVSLAIKDVVAAALKICGASTRKSSSALPPTAPSR